MHHDAPWCLSSNHQKLRRIPCLPIGGFQNPNHGQNYTATWVNLVYLHLFRPAWCTGLINATILQVKLGDRRGLVFVCYIPPAQSWEKPWKSRGMLPKSTKSTGHVACLLWINVGVSFYHHSFIHAVEVISTLKTTGTRAALLRI